MQGDIEDLGLDWTGNCVYTRVLVLSIYHFIRQKVGTI